MYIYVCIYIYIHMYVCLLLCIFWDSHYNYSSFYYAYFPRACKDHQAINGVDSSSEPYSLLGTKVSRFLPGFQSSCPNVLRPLSIKLHGKPGTRARPFGKGPVCRECSCLLEKPSHLFSVSYTPSRSQLTPLPPLLVVFGVFERVGGPCWPVRDFSPLRR